ncbi:hypothetical protein Golob_021452 [Gossypium lobatum]|uniref:Uncharacterized protein n=1 Tax=Gossypium lobatum TaxID=34289 RepID=A0A7J8LDW7_9ROSI|nr:hypothetical protein [Gossypium lobatum]
MEKEMAGLKIDDGEEEAILLPIDSESQKLAYEFYLFGCFLTIRSGSPTRDLAMPHQMNVHEAYSERTTMGIHGISLYESRGTNLHIPKEFTCREPQDLACDLEWYMYPTCLRSAQNVSPMNSGVKS